MHYLFLTNTCWAESPRIRHQLARLLSDNGDTVFFFEKASFRFWKYLDVEVKNGVKDIFYSDDTHWSHKASEAIFKNIRF